MSGSETRATENTSGNRLRHARSAYLRSAAHQPIDWHEWGDEAFEKARRENKPVLLDVGAVWCHWCHVMDHESYESAEIARLINERFVAVKVDRDERPDVDARYQKVVGAITGQGGWPLTAFLTPEGNVFYGGTYFPPRDAMGRPGFPRVLEAVADAFRERRDEVVQQAENLHAEVRRRSAPKAPSPDTLSEAMLAEALGHLQSQFDPKHGGWGDAPKFPHPATMTFVLRRLARAPERATLADLTRLTLERMAKGGVYDQVGGGFHRYSVDSKWIVPHFEKMLYDNAELLRNYVHAYQLFRDDLYRDVSTDIVRFMDGVLAGGATRLGEDEPVGSSGADRSRGCWGGSQDADVGPHDDGDFFTWTLDELREAVPDPAHQRLLALHFNVEERGEMHHDAAKNVLFVDVDAASIAEALGKSETDVREAIHDGLLALREARAKREAPFVDPTVYVNWNGMAASAYLEYAAALDRPEARDFALRSIDRILAEAYVDGEGFSHSLGEGAVRGLLDDNAQMLQALLHAFDATGEADYVAVARDVADLIVAEFWSDEHSAFVDVAARLHGGTGALASPEVPLHDNPSPSAAGVAILSLLRLGRTTGESRYVDAARRALEGAAGEARRAGLFAGQLLLAADALLHEGAHVLVAAHGPNVERFRAAALAAFDPAKTVTVVDPAHPIDEQVPQEAKGLLETHAPPVAVVCVGTRCLAPARSPEDLAERMAQALRVDG